MSYLSWISDEHLTAAVTRMVESVRSACKKTENNISRNGLDPFSLLFNISLLSHNVDSWKSRESARQAEKGLTNALGVFHQEVVAHVKGWQDTHTSQDFDLINHEKRIVVEMKNKYNTLNAEGLKSCFMKLSNAVSNKHSSFYQYTAYCVNIVPKRAQIGAVPFVVKDNAMDSNSRLCNDRVFLIDGHSFYALATGVPSALRELLDILPKVMSDITLSSLDKDSVAYINRVFEETYTIPERRNR